MWDEKVKQVCKCRGDVHWACDGNGSGILERGSARSARSYDNYLYPRIASCATIFVTSHARAIIF